MNPWWPNSPDGKSSRRRRGSWPGPPWLGNRPPSPATRCTHPRPCPRRLSSSRLRPWAVDLGYGKISKAWVYNGLLPGPTIRARTGDNATITLKNGLPTEPTITHWHGMLVTHENDGHPMEAIGPGGTYSYAFPILNRAALMMPSIFSALMPAM